MRHFVFLVLSLFVATPAQAADGLPDLEPYRPVVKSIIDEALSNPVAYRNLEELTRVAPGRLAGTVAAAAAVEWARQKMIDTGLENVRLQPVMVPHWDRGRVAELHFLAPPEVAGQKIRFLALGGSVATPLEGVSAEVIMVKSFEELAQRKDAAQGKIVLFNRPMDPTLRDTFSAYGGAVGQRSQGAVKAARAGGVAALVRSVTTSIDDVPHTGGMHYQPNTPRIPTAAVSTIAADRIASLIESGKTVKVFFRQDCRWREDAPSHNVIGDYRGITHPEEIVVVGGHLDSWDIADGAHDDGSGVCHAIEVVRVLKALGLRPKRTIRVIAFMNEENGTRGAKAYYKEHLEEMDRHVMALESDRGGFTPRGFTTDANEAMPIFQAIAPLFEDAGATVMRKGSGGADVAPMKKSGVVTVGFLPDSQRYFDLHHTEEDTIDKVSVRELQLGAGVIASLVYIVADLEHPIPRNPKTE